MRTLPKVYSQRDPQWASQRLGTVDGSTIGLQGCYVSSFAMIAEYYGKNVTPAQLDDLFTNLHVYVNDQGQHIDPANEATDNMLQTIYGDIIFQKTYDYANNPADLGVLKTLLADPTVSVILELDFDHNPNDGIQTHFVVAVDCDGSQVTIADPWYGSEDNFTKNYGNNPTQTILKYVVYRGTPVQQASTANMYGGLDLNNPESMKPCVDLFNQWKNGELIDKAKYAVAVANGAEYEAFVNAGYKSVDDITKVISDLKTARDNNSNAYQEELTKNSDLSGQINSLQGQVNTLNETNTGLKTQIAQVQDRNSVLASEIQKMETSDSTAIDVGVKAESDLKEALADFDTVASALKTTYPDVKNILTAIDEKDTKIEQLQKTQQPEITASTEVSESKPFDIFDWIADQVGKAFSKKG